MVVVVDSRDPDDNVCPGQLSPVPATWDRENFIGKSVVEQTNITHLYVKVIDTLQMLGLA